MALSYAANRGSKGGVGGSREGRVGTQLIATSLYQSGLASAGAPPPRNQGAHGHTNATAHIRNRLGGFGPPSSLCA